MPKSKASASRARLLVMLAAILWLVLTLVSVYYAIGDGAVLYVPELSLIAVTSVILLGWAASISRFPHLSGKVGYLSILISIMNLLALTIIGGLASHVIGIYPNLAAQHAGNLSAIVPNIAFYVAYIATAAGIVGGAAIIRSKPSA